MTHKKDRAGNLVCHIYLIILSLAAFSRWCGCCCVR